MHLPALFLVLLFASQASAYQQIDFVGEIGAGGKEQRLLHAPQAVTIAEDRVYVADTDNHRVVVLDRSGKAVLTWGSKGSRAGQFKFPSGIAFDEEGRVFIADRDNHRVQVFTKEGKWLRAFGSKGDNGLEFNSPEGIAVSKGLLYVADTYNDRVQAVTLDGIFISEITGASAKDRLKKPAGVAVDSQNRLAVLDTGNNRVRVFDPAGRQLFAFGSRGGGASGFEGPRGVAVDTRGNIYVADTGNHKIKKFDRKGKLVGSVGSEGEGPGKFREVSGVFVDPFGRIWAVDADRNTVQAFTAEGDDAPALAPLSPLPSVEFVGEMRAYVSALVINNKLWGLMSDSLSLIEVKGGREISARGTKPGMLRNAWGLAVDGAGHFWVADTGNHRLQKFNKDGDLLQVIGRSGGGDGEFHYPSGVAVSPKGSICVADMGNNRVQVFNARGVFLGEFGKQGKKRGQFGELVDIAVDEEENIYVVDRGNNRIAKYDNDGSLLWETGGSGSQDGQFRKPENIVVSPDREVYVLDAGNARIQVFDGNGNYLRKFGSEGIEAGQFRDPRGLVLEDGVRLYVGDRGNNRVQVFLIKQTPAVPTGLAAQPRPNQVLLSWRPGAETWLETYQVYRAESGLNTFALIASTTLPFYVDDNLPSSRSYLYRVSSRAREGNESAMTGAVSATTPKLIPRAPRRVRTGASENQITLSWLPEREPFGVRYQVYRARTAPGGFALLTTTDRAVVTDSGLDDDTRYFYQVTAVGREGDESPPSPVVSATTPKAAPAQLEIVRIEAGEAFASTGSRSLGKVVIRNNTDEPFRKIRLGFSIEDYTDFPAEAEIAEIGPKDQVEVALTPSFNARVAEVSENALIKGEVTLAENAGGGTRTVARSFPILLYERHAMRWDRKEKLGAFVTPADPTIKDLSGLILRRYKDAYPNLPRSVVYARGVFTALGVLGIRYTVDPVSPFREFSAKTSSVDYLQYPRDTLERKSGDCDDLSVLFAALMESIGTAAAFVDVPGSLFVMFDTGVPEKDKITLGFPDELLAAYQGTVWLPVDVTMVGMSFTRAWQRGAEAYHAWAAKKKATVISVRKSWEEFRPAALPEAELAVRVSSADLEAAQKNELDGLGRSRLAYLSAAYRELLKKKPGDLTTLERLGMLYSENGLTDEALEQFQKMLALDTTNASAFVNIGDINWQQGRFDDARLAYETALKTQPSNPAVMVKLARVFLQTGKKEEAVRLFREAMAIDRKVRQENADLAGALGVK